MTEQRVESFTEGGRVEEPSSRKIIHSQRSSAPPPLPRMLSALISRGYIFFFVSEAQQQPEDE
jgi:hypothetical protein